MSDPDKIQGKKRFDIFNKLIKEKSLVKMQILRAEYEQLTIITGIRTQGNSPLLLVDSPKNLDDAVKDLDKVGINFEFSEKDGIRFNFKCTGGKILKNELWVAFPDYIERIQRRKDFRLWFSGGTIINFEMDSIRYKMSLKNISMGGVYLEISMARNEDKEIQVFKPGDIFADIELTFPLEEEELNVHIDKASVIRASELGKQKGFSIGLQFIEIEKNEINILKKIIYDFQRSFLQRRLKTDA